MSFGSMSRVIRLHEAKHQAKAMAKAKAEAKGNTKPAVVEISDSEKASQADGAEDVAKVASKGKRAREQVPENDNIIHRLSMTRATKSNPRAYITACRCADPERRGKHQKSLIVEYRPKQYGPGYLAKAEEALAYLKEHNLKYSEARDIQKLI